MGGVREPRYNRHAHCTPVNGTPKGRSSHEDDKDLGTHHGAAHGQGESVGEDALRDVIRLVVCQFLGIWSGVVFKSPPLFKSGSVQTDNERFASDSRSGIQNCERDCMSKMV